MKRLFGFFLLTVFSAPAANAQFAILTPPAVIHAVEDIDADSGRIIFATDSGVMVYNPNQTWSHFNSSRGVTNSHIMAVKHYGGGFLYSDDKKRLGRCNFTTASDYVLGQSYNYISALSIQGPDTLLGTDVGSVLRKNATAVTPVSLPLPLGTLNRIMHITNAAATADFYALNSSNRAMLYNSGSNQVFQVVDTDNAPVYSNNFISSTIHNGVAYNGTDRGIFFVDFNGFPSAGLSWISRADGLVSDTVSACAANDTFFFAGTPKGLTVTKDFLNWTTYTTANSNLPSNDVTELLIDNGTLWLGTRQGNICKLAISQIRLAAAATLVKDESIIVYPNPTADLLTVEAPGAPAGLFELHGISGQVIFRSRLSGGRLQVSLSSQPPGLYPYLLMSRNGELLKSGYITIRR